MICSSFIFFNIWYSCFSDHQYSACLLFVLLDVIKVENMTKMIFSTGVSFRLIILSIEATITFLRTDRAIRNWSWQSKHQHFNNTLKRSVKKVAKKLHYSQVLKTGFKLCCISIMIYISAQYVRCLSNLIQIAKSSRSAATPFIYYTFRALQSIENFMIIMDGTWYVLFVKKKFKIQT